MRIVHAVPLLGGRSGAFPRAHPPSVTRKIICTLSVEKREKRLLCVKKLIRGFFAAPDALLHKPRSCCVLRVHCSL
jgi:hypothetical protein